MQAPSRFCAAIDTYPLSVLILNIDFSFGLIVNNCLKYKIKFIQKGGKKWKAGQWLFFLFFWGPWQWR